MGCQTWFPAPNNGNFEKAGLGTSIDIIFENENDMRRTQRPGSAVVPLLNTNQEIVGSNPTGVIFILKKLSRFEILRKIHTLNIIKFLIPLMHMKLQVHSSCEAALT